jgi:rRNA maturation RNase YbeY
VAVSFHGESVSLPPIKRRGVARWIKGVVAGYGKKMGNICCVFCSDGKILELNQTYLQHDYYTDVITFDYTEGDTVAGELYISLDTVKTNAESLHTDFDEELHRVIIHGILHLCGINDKTEEDCRQMRHCEEEALRTRP